MAGLQAARAAGMRVVAVTHRSNAAGQAEALADLVITDYTCLEDDFFAKLARQSGKSV